MALANTAASPSPSLDLFKEQWELLSRDEQLEVVQMLKRAKPNKSGRVRLYYDAKKERFSTNCRVGVTTLGALWTPKDKGPATEQDLKEVQESIEGSYEELFKMLIKSPKHVQNEQLLMGRLRLEDIKANSKIEWPQDAGYFLINSYQIQGYDSAVAIITDVGASGPAHTFGYLKGWKFGDWMISAMNKFPDLASMLFVDKPDLDTQDLGDLDRALSRLKDLNPRSLNDRFDTSIEALVYTLLHLIKCGREDYAKVILRELTSKVGFKLPIYANLVLTKIAARLGLPYYLELNEQTIKDGKRYTICDQILDLSDQGIKVSFMLGLSDPDALLDQIKPLSFVLNSKIDELIVDELTAKTIETYLERDQPKGQLFLERVLKQAKTTPLLDVDKARTALRVI